MSKTKRFVLIVLIATVLGPLIGGLLVFLATLASMPFQPGFTVGGLSEISLTSLGETFVIVVGVAYLVGGVLAFAAGLIVALVGLWREPTFLIVIVAVVVANVGYFAVIGPEAFIDPTSTFPFEQLAISLAFSVIAATVCWLLFRRRLRVQ